MLNEGQEKNRVEQVIQLILELGSVPMEAFRATLHNLSVLEKPAPINVRKMLLVGVFTGLALLSSACEAPGEMDPELYAQFVLSDYAIAQAAEQARQAQADQEAQVEPVSYEFVGPYQPREFDHQWSRQAEIMAGEGVLTALSRVSKTEAREHDNVPEEYFQVIIIHHFGDPNQGPPEVYNWANLDSNPVVYPGDVVIHMFLTQNDLQLLKADYPFLELHID